MAQIQSNLYQDPSQGQAPDWARFLSGMVQGGAGQVSMQQQQAEQQRQDNQKAMLQLAVAMAQQNRLNPGSDLADSSNNMSVGGKPFKVTAAPIDWSKQENQQDTIKKTRENQPENIALNAANDVYAKMIGTYGARVAQSAATTVYKNSGGKGNAFYDPVMPPSAPVNPTGQTASPQVPPGQGLGMQFLKGVGQSAAQAPATLMNMFAPKPQPNEAFQKGVDKYHSEAGYNAAQVQHQANVSGGKLRVRLKTDPTKTGTIPANEYDPSLYELL